MSTFCPATMCPLFAAEGSPWTGQKNAVCPQRHGEYPADGGCIWYQGFGGTGCDGAAAAASQVIEAEQHGSTFQIGPVQQKRGPASPRTYDCPRAGDCQWQVEAGAGLCPPRLALSNGIDARVCAW